MAKYSGKGWHFQTERHSKAAKTGCAGGVYSYQQQKTFQPTLEYKHDIRPIKIKITKKEIRRVKNQLEKDLQKAIEQTKNIEQKKELMHLYRELRKADSHNAIKRYWSVYGNTLETIAMALPFQLVVPIEMAGIILGTGLTKEIDASQAVRSLAVPIAAFGISSTATKMSIRTYKAIKKREKEIIAEKTIELKKDTNIPDKEIHEIAKRVARKELSQTKIVHQISEKPKI